MPDLCPFAGWLVAGVVVGALLLGVGLGAMLAGWLPIPSQPDQTVETPRHHRGKHRRPRTTSWIGHQEPDRRLVSRPKPRVEDRDTVLVQVVDPPKRGGGRG